MPGDVTFPLADISATPAPPPREFTIPLADLSPPSAVATPRAAPRTVTFPIAAASAAKPREFSIPLTAVSPAKGPAASVGRIEPGSATVDLYRRAKAALSSFVDWGSKTVVPEHVITSGLNFLDDYQAGIEAVQLKAGMQPDPGASAGFGFTKGAAEATVRTLATPFQLALTALGIGETAVLGKLNALVGDIPKIEAAARAAKELNAPKQVAALSEELVDTVKRMRDLQRLRAVTYGAKAATGAGFTVEGAHKLVTAPTWSEKAAGVAEIAGGVAMGLHGVGGMANAADASRAATIGLEREAAATPTAAPTPEAAAVPQAPVAGQPLIPAKVQPTEIRPVVVGDPTPPAPVPARVVMSTPLQPVTTPVVATPAPVAVSPAAQAPPPVPQAPAPDPAVSAILSPVTTPVAAPTNTDEPVMPVPGDTSPTQVERPPNATPEMQVSTGTPTERPSSQPAGSDEALLVSAHAAVAAAGETTPAIVTPHDRFVATYAKGLTGYSNEEAVQQAVRVARALARGVGNVHTPALKGAADALGVQPSVAGWKAFFAASAPAPLDTPAPVAQTSAHVGRTEAGTGLQDGAGQQPGAVQGGRVEGPGDGGRPAPRRVSAAGIPTPEIEQFRRQPQPDNAARLTPEVTRELERIRDELHEFTFTPHSWHWIPQEENGWNGNAAGGHANVTSGAAGAPVYDDVLTMSPYNKGKGSDGLARHVRGSRSDVEAAIGKMLDTGDIHSNLAEGAVRVAEARAAGVYHFENGGGQISKPLLPPHWGEEAPQAFTDAISDAFDDALGNEDGDASFDPDELDRELADVRSGGVVKEDVPAYGRRPPAAQADLLDTGEAQPRLPGDVGAVRDQSVATPQLDAPFSLTSEAGPRKKGSQATLFEQGADYARRPGTNTAASTALCRSALSDLAAVTQSAVSARMDVPPYLRPKPTVRALGITPALINTQRLELRGQVITRGAHDIASLAQVARDPRFETLRVVYVKTGPDGSEHVLATEAISSRLPDAVVGFCTTPALVSFQRANTARYGADVAKWPEAVRDTRDGLVRNASVRFLEGQRARMTRLGADGYYLVHNHPSGDSTPSMDDRVFTVAKTKARADLPAHAPLQGLRGHVVIDHDEYSVIAPNGAVSRHRITSAENLHAAAVPHAVIGQVVQDPVDVRTVGQQLTQPGGVTIIYTAPSKTGGTKQNIVRAVETVPHDMLLNPEFRGFLRNRQSAYGGSLVMLYVDQAVPAAAGAKARRLYADGTVADVVVGGSDIASSDTPWRRRGRIETLPATHRVSEDTAPYGKQITASELQELAKRRGMSIHAVRAAATKAGYTVVEGGPRPVTVSSGRTVPPRKPLDPDDVLAFPSVQKMPAAIRADVVDLMTRYHGFEAQRRGVQSVARTQELAKDVWLPLETLKPGTALNAEELEAYKTAIATALTERQAVLARIADGTATDFDRLQAVHLTNVATTLTASYRGAKAEVGRAMHILRVQARVLELRESKFLEAALRAPGFHGDVAAISKAALDVAHDPLGQLKLLRQRSQGTWFDYLQAGYYTNLLSGIKTHERNAIGNAVNLLANLIVPVGAAPLDAARSLHTGQPRTVYIREVPHAVAGAFVGLEQGWRRACFTFREGFRPSEVAAAAEGVFDTPRIELPGGRWTNWPSRALESADEFFRAIAWYQEMYAGAYASARRQGATGRAEIAGQMAALMAAVDPSTPAGKEHARLADQADTFAARSVFQEDPGGIVKWLLKAKGPTSPLPLRAISLFLTPFIKTPSAVLRQGLEWTPAGFVMRAARADGSKDGGGRAGAQARGRAAIGVGLLGAAAWLAATGRLTGAAPDDPGEREEFYAQGKQPNAVKVGNHWVRYVLFQPFAVSLAAVSNAWKTFEHSDQDEGAAETAFSSAVAGAGASLIDQSFLSGLGTFLDAVNDPTRYSGQWLSLFTQGLVPFSGAMRNVTQAVDPVVRKPQGVAESVKAIVPGLSSSLPARRDRFGEVVTRPGSAVQRGFIVPEMSTAVNDDVTETLARLHVRPQASRAEFTVKGKPVTLTRAQQDVVSEAIGRERRLSVDRLFRAPGFKEASDEAQRRQVKQAMDAATDRVRPRALQMLAGRRDATVQALVSPAVWAQMQADQAAGRAFLGASKER